MESVEFYDSVTCVNIILKLRMQCKQGQLGNGKISQHWFLKCATAWPKGRRAETSSSNFNTYHRAWVGVTHPRSQCISHEGRFPVMSATGYAWREKPPKNTWNRQILAWYRTKRKFRKQRVKQKGLNEDIIESRGTTYSCNGFYRASKRFLSKKAWKLRDKLRSKKTLKSPSISSSKISFLSIKSARKKDPTDISSLSDHGGYQPSFLNSRLARQARASKSTARIATLPGIGPSLVASRSARLQEIFSDHSVTSTQFSVDTECSLKNRSLLLARFSGNVHHNSFPVSLEKPSQASSSGPPSKTSSCHQLSRKLFGLLHTESGFSLERKANNLPGCLAIRRSGFSNNKPTRTQASHHPEPPRKLFGPFHTETSGFSLERKANNLPACLKIPRSGLSHNKPTRTQSSHHPEPPRKLFRLLPEDARRSQTTGSSGGTSGEESYRAPARLLSIRSQASVPRRAALQKTTTRETTSEASIFRECFGVTVEYPVNVAQIRGEALTLPLPQVAQKAPYEGVGEDVKPSFWEWFCNYFCCCWCWCVR